MTHSTFWFDWILEGRLFRWLLLRTPILQRWVDVGRLRLRYVHISELVDCQYSVRFSSTFLLLTKFGSTRTVPSSGRACPCCQSFVSSLQTWWCHFLRCLANGRTLLLEEVLRSWASTKRRCQCQEHVCHLSNCFAHESLDSIHRFLAGLLLA